MTRFFVSLYNKLSHHRWLTFAIIGITFVIFCLFAAQIHFEEDLTKLLPPSQNPEASLAFRNLKVKDKIFVQITSADLEHPLSTQQLADLSSEFADALLTVDSANHYIDNLFYQIDDNMILGGIDYATTYLPTLIDTSLYVQFDSILTPQNIAYRMQCNHHLLYDEGREDLSQLITSDPVGLRYAFLASGNPMHGEGGFTVKHRQLFSPDTVVALIFLAPRFDAFDSNTSNELVREVELQRDHFEAVHPEVEVLFHGAPVQSAYNSRQIKHDLLWTLLVSIIIVCAVIWLCFRSFDTVPLLLMPIVYGTAFALACMYWIQGTMSLMAMGIGAVVLGVALSYVLHVLTHYKHVTDPVRVLSEQARPVCLGCLTTIGAFAGLLFTDSPLLRDFGLFASFALIGTTLFALIFLPHFFRQKGSAHSERAFFIIDRFNSIRFDNLPLVIAICVVSLACFYTQSWVTFDPDMNHMGYVEPDVARSREMYKEHVNHGYTSQFYAVAAPTLDSAIIANRNMTRAVARLRADSTIASASALSSLLVTTDCQQQRIDRWKEYWTDDRISRTMSIINSEGAKQGFAPGTFDMFESLLYADYEPGSLAESGALPDGFVSNIAENVKTSPSDSSWMLFTSMLMKPERKQQVNDSIAAIPGALVVDPFYYASDMLTSLNNDFNMVLLISSIFVFIVLLCSFRNLWYSLIAFLPMFLSWYIVQGVMGIFGMQFNMINIVISTFIFGIGVDYSIFIMDGMLAERENAALLMHHKAAIFLSAFVLIVAVGSLAFATHPVLRSIGVTTLIGMVSTILLAYSLQPYLFKKFCRSRRAGKTK